MRNWLILLSVGSVLIGCATAPNENPWADIDVPVDSAVRPDPLPDRPLPVVTDDGLLFDRAAVGQLEAYFIAAEAAEDIAHAHAAQVDELRKAAQALVEAGQAQRRLAEIRQEILDEERKSHAIQKLGLYGIVIAVIGAAAL